MPVKRPDLINGEIYHIVMRGTEGRIIFPKKEDYFRFIHDLFEFNNEEATPSTYRFYVKTQLSGGNLARPDLAKFAELGPARLGKKRRKLLIEILSFCLMPNHFHLLLRQLKNQGTSRFMQKLNGGYATYINKKYERKGHLFQGRFRAVHIKNEEQLKNVFVYIHVNPTDLIELHWKEKGIKNPNKAISFLENYRWSSYPDYIGKNNFPSVTNRNFITKILGGPEGCQKFVENWILYKAEIKNLGPVMLE